jgi:hypothetical protein
LDILFRSFGFIAPKKMVIPETCRAH